MAGGTPPGTHGIVGGPVALEHFRLSRQAPSPDLASLVAYHWVLTWDLRGRAPHRQRVLSHPSVHLTWRTDGRAEVTGVVRGIFTETIEGRGRVIGVRFRPGGFRPFLTAPVSTLTDRTVPVRDLFGRHPGAVTDTLTPTGDTHESITVLEELLRPRRPERTDPLVDEAATSVDRIATDPGLLRVSDLAADLGTGVRRLQRLFADYVGVSPKWVIRRYRIQEAAEHAAAGTEVDWSALAVRLGYADQAHFTRDFSATLGLPPARYAQMCAAGAVP